MWILRSDRSALWLAVALATLILGSGRPTLAQDNRIAVPPVPSSADMVVVPAEVPAEPGRAPTGTPISAPSAREAQLEAKIQQLQSQLERLSDQVEILSKRPAAPAPTTQPPAGWGAGGGGAAPAGSSGAGSATGGGTGTGGGAVSRSGTVRENVPADVGGSAASQGPLAPSPNSRFEMPASPVSIPAKTKFGPGFQIATEDDEFQFQFHDLTQIDYRGYWPTPSHTLTQSYRSTFGVPRQWFVFSGRVGKPFEYYVVPAFGFDNINLLDAFLNIHFVDWLQVKIGRYKTPFTYEFYNLPINALLNPERSLFFNNFGLNRDVGIMAWGQLFQKRIDYAVGVFDGSRNFYFDRNSTPDLAALVNFRPFGTQEGFLFENLNFGGSVECGNEFQQPVPQLLRTNVATSGSSFFGVPFLGFNNNVVESGFRTLWDLHAAWYVGGWSFIGEWGSGVQGYALTSNPANRTHVPIGSYYFQSGYFITGEQVQARGAIKPMHNFDLRPGKLGLGAIELAGRFSTLDLGNQVFTNGLADPNLWSRRANLIDVGVNWYWNQYIKVYLGWQHADFANPVFLDPTHFQSNNNMLWARFQVFF